MILLCYFTLMVFMIITDNCYQKCFISDKKMGGLFLRNEPKIKRFDLTPPYDDFDYLRPKGTITFTIDRIYNVPLIDIRFYGWYENSVRL